MVQRYHGEGQNQRSLASSLLGSQLTPGRVPQGTGIVNTLLFDLPWESAHPTFRAIGCAFLVIDMVLFAAFTFLTVLRYYLSPRIFVAMLRHETHSLFLGTIPMGLITIVSGIAATGEEYGLKTLDTALVLYWITVGTYPSRLFHPFRNSQHTPSLRCPPRLPHSQASLA